MGDPPHIVADLRDVVTKTADGVSDTASSFPRRGPEPSQATEASLLVASFSGHQGIYGPTSEDPLIRAEDVEIFDNEVLGQGATCMVVMGRFKVRFSARVLLVMSWRGDSLCG